MATAFSEYRLYLQRTTKLIMITFEQFVQELKKGGSYQSARFNSLVLLGVDGMPTTHQIGFGKALRSGINPAQVSMAWVNDNTHSRMAMVLGGAAITGATIAIPLVSLVAGSLTGIGLYELYLDWKAGFHAVQYLPHSYFNEFRPIRNVRRLVYQY